MTPVHFRPVRIWPMPQLQPHQLTTSPLDLYSNNYPYILVCLMVPFLYMLLCLRSLFLYFLQQAPLNLLSKKK